MLNPAPKNVGGRVPKLSLILTLSPQGCDKGRGIYRWPETTNIYIRNKQHAAFQMEKDKETHGLSVLDHLALTFGKPSWFELMLWFGTYMTDKDTVLVDRQTRAEVWKVINEIVGEADSVSSLTSDHANSLSESLRPHLENVMTSCYERETLSVAECPREKRQCKEPDDCSESELREDSEDLYGDVKEIEDSAPGFLEPGNSESGLQLPRTPAKVLNDVPLCFNLAAQPVRVVSSKAHKGGGGVEHP